MYKILPNYKRLQTDINTFLPNTVFFLMKICNRKSSERRTLLGFKSLIQKFNIMSLRNKVTLIGHTGKEVEIFNYENGNKQATVSIATNDYYTKANGEKVEETQWHNLVAYGKTAEVMEKYMPKGKEIAIEGKLTYRSYDDKDGVKRMITEIRVEELVLLGSK
ncbi:single-strand DNA-binding protein [Epilithonimonas xixisoli]|uniref:Single-stranded DNA-binding protein n=2 Tax=Weeksellaceae TaxID=2762318 RepID=A0A4R8IB66_9FLAO|nr:single-strand DNA-binding protein [Epilithonimonas xixisoli]